VIAPVKTQPPFPGKTKSMLVLTSYFNPMKSHRRLANYRTFRSRLDAPLLTVELSFEGNFELTPADADHLIQLSGGDVMWQKERLLNIALGAVPNDVENVAWIDCDVVFESKNWAQAATEALKSNNITQLFSEVRYLNRVNTDKLEFNGIPELVRSSAGSQLSKGDFKNVCLVRPASPDAPKVIWPANGFAFAAKKSVICDGKLYDHGVLDGNDILLLCAIYGEFELAMDRLKHNKRQRQHYLDWARRAQQSFGGTVGYIPGTIYHLWHGDLSNRNYMGRHELMAEFDPYRDIKLAPNGPWLWRDPYSELAKNVKDYFRSRKEDG
jgi:hypothetical protein